MKSKLRNLISTVGHRKGWAFESVPSLAVLTLGLLTTALLTYFAHYAVMQDRQARFDHYSRQVVNDIQSRLAAYSGTLEDTRSLFLLHPGTSREQFRAFVQSMKLPTKYPGSIGIGFVPIIAPDRLRAHVAAVRKDVPRYKIWPSGIREMYSSILYIEPGSSPNSPSLGYDMLTEPIRRAALERARDTGEPAMSRKVTLLQDREQAKAAGFILSVPIFRKGARLSSVSQRRNALVGFVISPFRAQDLFSHITGDVTSDGILGVEIFDGSIAERSSATLLYDDEDSTKTALTAPVPGKLVGADLNSTVQLEIAGTPWTVSFAPGPHFDKGVTNNMPWYVLFCGIAVTILLYRVWSDYDSYNSRLRESESRLKLVTDSLPALIALIGDDGTYQFANAAHAEWFNISSADAVGRPLESVLAQSADESSREGFARARRGERITFEMRVSHGTQGIRRVKVDCIPRPGQTSGGFVALATDITELMRLVEALKESEAKYRATSSENEQHYKQAQNLNRAKDDFLATLSHELRTPLTVILGHAELLKELPNPTEEVAESIESILRNARSQNQLVSDLIDVSSIITGKITLQMNVVRIADMMKGALESCRLAAQAKTITLISQLRDETSFIRGDMNRLQQITTNLLTNAIKFTPAHGQISVSGALLGEFYELRVRDSGKGIEAEFLPHVFDRFRQEDNSMTRHHGGLGLGLSIVSNLVEAHHGTVEARSQGRDLGAEFIVRIPAFPALPAEFEHEAALKAPLQTGERTRRLLENKRVLIVDDEPDARRLVARYLERAGATVHPTGSAKEALAALAFFAPDLIISDIGMPDEDGYSLIRRIREEENRAARTHVPAIALTAYAREEDRQKAFQAGYQAHLPKPVGSAKLTDMALATLDRADF